jgi:GT2 family glycosyltransferase
VRRQLDRSALDRLVGSITGRSGSILRTLAGILPFWIKSPLKRFLHVGEQYDQWVKNFDTLSDSDRFKIQAHILDLNYNPLISVIMPVYETPGWALQEAIDSVRTQLYPNWELCIADDASRSPHITTLLRQAAAIEPRIKWMRREKNGHISAASNSALTLATGEFVALMDHDDLLPQHALYEVVVAINKDPKLDIIYSDEDQIDRKGRRSHPYFKTDWNIDLLLGHNMISHLGVYRRTLIERVGGFREGFEGSQDYDLALRCADATNPNRIRHIPSVLYHWRRDYGATSFSEGQLAKCSDAALRAINDHLKRRHEVGEAKSHPMFPQWSRVVRPVSRRAPLVSVIVQLRAPFDLLRACVEGLLNRTDYPAIEVLILGHESNLPGTFQLFETLELDPRLRIIPYSGTFNSSAVNNMAVAKAKGTIICLLSADTDVIKPDWLSEMVSLAIMDGVGAVGAKLIYPNHRVQHGGIAVSVDRVANYVNHSMRQLDIGYFGRNVLTSSVSAVTGACLVVRKSLFQEVGGLNETQLAAAFSDVDFCLKLRKNGYRNIWTPHAVLYNYGFATGENENTAENETRFRSEVQYMQAVWRDELEREPFYNNNFSVEIGQHFQLAFPPRGRKSWHPKDVQ